MHIFCKTPRAILLCGVRDAAGIFRFPMTPGSPLPGLLVEVQALMPVTPQLFDALTGVIPGAPFARFEVVQEYSDLMRMPEGEEITLFAARLEEAGVATAGAGQWPTLPEMMRAMPRDRSRVPYLRAWQVLSGGLTIETKAVEAADVARYFDD